jgi:4,5:9,10-diseco-3-hydroxy-5,9,17-trioxoandrosta-1(10),2-diene-4-oate hydrolase
MMSCCLTDESLKASGQLTALSAAAPGDFRVLPGGVHVAVKRWGRGTPVLCLHAVGHASGDFEDLSVRLGNDFELIALDWPGMGRSPADGVPVRAKHFADLLLEALDILGVSRPLVIGNSIGGMAAIIAASTSPQRFAGLVLCNPGGLAPLDPAARFVIGRMVVFFGAGARGANWFPWAFRAYYRHLVLPRRAAKAQRDRIVRASQALAPILADAWAGFAESSGDLRALAPRLDLPVWLAWTKGDRFVSWSRAKAAVAGMPCHSVSLFRGGHAAFLEDPDAFEQGFRAFAADVHAGRF